jgi:hypothetical protein
MNRNFRSDAAGFPGDDKPPKRPLSGIGFGDDRARTPKDKDILRGAIDDTLRSLGTPIFKTITWHMNNRGVFFGEKLDMAFFHSNLRELIGPGADYIMEEIWTNLKDRRSSDAA